MNPMANWWDHGRYEGTDDDSQQRGKPVKVTCRGKNFGTIAEVGQFDKRWRGCAVEHMVFSTPLHIEAGEDVEVDWIKRTARVVKRKEV